MNTRLFQNIFFVISIFSILWTYILQAERISDCKNVYADQCDPEYLDILIFTIINVIYIFLFGYYERLRCNENDYDEEDIDTSMFFMMVSIFYNVINIIYIIIDHTTSEVKFVTMWSFTFLIGISLFCLGYCIYYTLICCLIQYIFLNRTVET